MNFNVNKNVFLRFTLLVGSIFSFTYTMQRGLTPIACALLVDQIEKNGVESVRKAMKEPKPIYDEERDLCGEDITILEINTVLEKNDSNPLAKTIFAEIEKIEKVREANPYYKTSLLSSKPYGVFWDLEQHSCTRYAWQGQDGQRLPKIIVKVGLRDKEAIEAVLESYNY